MRTIKVDAAHPDACNCGARDCPSSGGVFYVVARRRREAFEIAGPFECAQPAVDLLPQAWLFFWKLNPRNSHKWEITKYFGNPPYPRGLLNEQLEVAPLGEGRRPK